ncbi:hypothetical protein ABZ926_04300 [Streptomyces litmocidini]|uniref:hypothetical protein n=1 Tax=Streptomyces litmocidini TaxID=67318 RepID=UPI0033C27FFE
MIERIVLRALAFPARHGPDLLDGPTLHWLIDRDDAQALAVLDTHTAHPVTLAVPRTDGVSAPAATVPEHQRPR